MEPASVSESPRQGLEVIHCSSIRKITKLTSPKRASLLKAKLKGKHSTPENILVETRERKYTPALKIQKPYSEVNDQTVDRGILAIRGE